MNHFNSYPSVYAIGHRYLGEIPSDTLCRIEEKIDGSQFSFARTPEGALKVRSKRVDMHPEAPDSLFKKAVAAIASLPLKPGWVYRAEAVNAPKHNVLAYERVPTAHVVLFDIAVGLEDYLERGAIEQEATRLGLEVTPLLDMVPYGSFDPAAYAGRRSLLGGPIEGVVIKPVVTVWGQDKKPLIAKWVRDEFKETHRTTWKEPSGPDKHAALAARVCGEVRWAKAVARLRDEDRLQHAPQDIPLIMREVVEDVMKEEKDTLMEALLKMYWGDIRKHLTRGLPEWYKGQL